MEFRNSGGEWTPIAGTDGTSPNTNFTISSSANNVDLYVIAGSPATAGTYTITINPGVTMPFLQARRSNATTTAQAQIALVAGGIIRIRDPFAGVGDLTTRIAPNVDYGFGWFVNQRAGTQQLRLYSGGGVLLEESAPVSYSGLPFDQFTHGVLIAPTTPIIAWFDYVGYRTLDWVAPPTRDPWANPSPACPR